MRYREWEWRREGEREGERETPWKGWVWSREGRFVLALKVTFVIKALIVFLQGMSRMGRAENHEGRARARSCARSVVSECARAREQAAARGHHIGSGATRPEVGAFQLVPEKAFYRFFCSAVWCDVMPLPVPARAWNRPAASSLALRLNCIGATGW